jgi:hypothetical protein
MIAQGILLGLATICMAMAWRAGWGNQEGTANA